MKNIVFLNRAYNDMDIQCSLIDAYAGDSGYRVRVIGYPCDGYVGSPSKHESAPYLRSRGVSIETIFDSPQAPLMLKIVHTLQSTFRDMRVTMLGDIPGLALILKVLHVGLSKVLGQFLKGRRPWMERAAKDWDADAVILDEVSAQPNRSPIVDYALPYLAENGVKIYTILTGQNIYQDAFPSGQRPSYKPSVAIRTFVPSRHDAHIFSIQFPSEKTEVVGNLRMNSVWIKALYQKILVSPFYNRQRVLEKFPTGKIRVVFMLSKINYGIIDPRVLAETIRQIGNMPDVAVAIKPHTRGMKLDFLDPDDAGNSIDASEIPSPLLTEWADLVFFTGSGIAFHAMFLGKRVGLLKYCQELDTIFDAGECVDVLSSSAEAVALVESLRRGEDLPDSRKKQIREWLHVNVEAGATNGDVASLYKERIVADLL